MENPRAWLYRTARNLLTDEYRAARDVVVLEDEIPLPDAFHEAVSTLEICLPETLQALPDEERWLIEEADLNRRPQQRLADELGITLTAFKSRLLRARKHLKKTMTELCQVEVDDASSVCCHKNGLTAHLFPASLVYLSVKPHHSTLR